MTNDEHKYEEILREEGRADIDLMIEACCEGGAPNLALGLKKIKRELEAWQKVATSARAFIASHRADPDLSDEMILHYNAYKAAERKLEDFYREF